MNELPRPSSGPWPPGWELFLSLQGLFRVAPSASKLKKLKASLDCGVLDVQEYSADPHAIAGEHLLLSYLFPIVHWSTRSVLLVDRSYKGSDPTAVHIKFCLRLIWSHYSGPEAWPSSRQVGGHRWQSRYMLVVAFDSSFVRLPFSILSRE